MYKNILSGIQDIEMLGVFSLVIFFLFFVGLIIYVFSMGKKRVETLSNLPLNDYTTSKENSHEDNK